MKFCFDQWKNRIEKFGRPPFLLSFLVITGVVLRTVHLNQGLWFDEITSLVEFVRLPFWEIVTSYDGNRHMLHIVLAHFSTGWFGEHPWSLRLPAMIFGVLSIPALYLLGKLFTSKRESLSAAALLTFSYHHIWFSQNARGYAGLLFWTLISAYLFFRGLRHSRTILWVGYAVAVSLGIYEHLTMVFVFVSHIFIYLWQRSSIFSKRTNMHTQNDQPIFGFFLASLFTLMLYAPILPQVIHRWVGPDVPSGVSVSPFSPLWAIIETMSGLRVGFGIVGLIFAGILFLAGFISYAKENRFAMALIVLPGFFSFIFVIVFQHPIYPRFFYYLLGFAFLIFVRGSMTIGTLFKVTKLNIPPSKFNDGFGLTIIFLLIFFSIFSLKFTYSYPKQDFEGAMDFVERDKKEGKVIVTTGLASRIYKNYYGRNWKSINRVEELENYQKQGQGVWLLYTFPGQLNFGNPDLMAAIARDFSTVKVFRGTVGDGDIYVAKSGFPPKLIK